MRGTLLIAPTGSGKSYAYETELFFKTNGIDGDELADWSGNWDYIDWTVRDQENLDRIIKAMRSLQKCVLWFVGTTAIHDAITDGRLLKNEVAIVLIDETLHQSRVEHRRKEDHGWNKAIEHRRLCEDLIETHGLMHFDSFQGAATFLSSNPSQRNNWKR